MNPESLREIALSVYLNQQLLAVVPLELPGYGPVGGGSAAQGDPMPLAVHLTGDEKMLEHLRTTITRLEMSIEVKVGPTGREGHYGRAFRLDGNKIRTNRDWFVGPDDAARSLAANRCTYIHDANGTFESRSFGGITTFTYDHVWSDESDPSSDGRDESSSNDDPPGDPPFVVE